MVKVKTITSGPIATNALVVSDGSGKAAVIDPAPDAAGSIFDYVESEGLDVEIILITHSHWDHIADCAAVKERFGVPVAVHGEDALNLEKPGSDGLPAAMNDGIIGVKPDILLEDGQVIEVGTLKLQVLHSPGHCPGQVCFYSEEEGLLFPGDLFFHNAMGTLALPTAQPERMWPSLERVGKLPPETKVYPGHGSATLIGAEAWLLRAKDLGEDSWFPKFED